ncbi:hypothetical protein ACMGE9_03915 [Macrococcus sp. EM39E]|uniref:hypothetical protein n=1 Tax=Macrococcus animalis TaxID=3395467 RepID=UPI0039BE3A83
MSSDIVLEGRQVKIINELYEKNLFTGTRGSAELFFLAVLKGLYNSKEETMDVGGEQINISRTFLNNPKRVNFKYLINVFENLEQRFAGNELTMSQIFLDAIGTDDNDKFQLIKNHGYAGLELLYDELLVQKDIVDKFDVVSIIDSEILTREELDAIEIKMEPAINTIDDILESDI